MRTSEKDRWSSDERQRRLRDKREIDRSGFFFSVVVSRTLAFVAFTLPAAPPVKADDRVLVTERGLLIRWLQRSDAGSYLCTSQEQRFTRTLLRFSVRVVQQGQLDGHPSPSQRGPSEDPTASVAMAAEARQRYKDFLRVLSGPARSVDEYCEALWFREKRTRLRGKWKHMQELRKSRNRRHHH
ncbi:hypothetical protein AALO_G00149310 [Alosa alosa]|uniref:Uncharacterized protein n=1 Tax=Alosa alosa TaxID=278164 RepID=A0AAV6GKD3_9TELE|nr:hypothetical protein AALO_G00149310 [Alosa alosa]